MKFFQTFFIIVLIILGCTQEMLAFFTMKTTIRTNLRRTYKKIKVCCKRNQKKMLPVYSKINKQIISKENKKKNQILLETMLTEILGGGDENFHFNIPSLIATILISNPLLFLLKKKKSIVFILFLVLKITNLLIDTIFLPYLIHLLKTLMT